LKLAFKKHEEHICQSCSVSLKTQDNKGTETDGMLNDDYCGDCYEGGEFSEPEITLKEMIEQSVSSTSKSLNLTTAEARKYLESLLPTLKRWR
jgi:hypothetical protein